MIGTSDIAMYLPAVQEGFLEYIVSEDNDAPTGFSPKDLNFLDPDNRIWSYPFALASAGLLATSKKSNAVTSRNERSWILGDSGGYQIGTGKLPELKGWSSENDDVAKIRRMWRNTRFIDDMVRWVDCHCDYAMTLDMPLWMHEGSNTSNPFYNFSPSELLDVTLENLKFIDERRGIFGNCKFLNVMQGVTDEAEDAWYAKVKSFNFDGWALGGTEGWNGGLARVLRRLLILRDDGRLNAGEDVLHLLGVSQYAWSAVLTAVQRAVRATTNANFQITFDSATPFRNAYSYQSYFAPRNFDDNLRSWARDIRKFPTTYREVSAFADEPFCIGSPYSAAWSVGDVSIELDLFKNNFLSKFGSHALAAHNACVMTTDFAKCHAVTFNEGSAPTEILDSVDMIQRLFASERWNDLLTKNRNLFEYVSNKSIWSKI